MSAIDLPADDREGGDMRSRLMLVSLLAVGLLGAGATSVLAIGVVDQEQLDVSQPAYYAGNPELGQTFVAGMTGALDSVAVYPNENFAGWSLKIMSCEKGLPTGTVLASTTVSSTQDGTWITTAFQSPAIVVKGTQYALIVAPAGPGAIRIYQSPVHSDSYPHGNIVLTADGTTWFASDLDADLGFMTYVTPARPDGLIAKGSHKFVGNDTYNTDGTQQTRLATPRIGDLTLFRIAVQNDGIVPDSFRIQAAGSEPYYSIRYYRHSKEITSRVVAGTFTTPVLAPGDRYVIRVWVKVATLAAAPSASRLVTLTSVNDPTKVDAVQFVVRPQ